MTYARDIKQNIKNTSKNLKATNQDKVYAF